MVKNQSGKMKILFVILTVTMIGLMIPSASAEIFIHESTPQFSIQHPNGWIIQEIPEERGVMIDADMTGRNGMGISLICSGLYGEDCGNASNIPDYQWMQYLKEDITSYCDSSNYQDNYMICYNQEIVDEYFHYIDGLRAFSILTEETWHQDGKDPYFPDAGGAHVIFTVNTYVVVGNEIWYIFIANDYNNFSMEQSEKILSTFKIKHIYDQVDIFTPPTWYEQLIDAIMSLFGGGNNEPSTSNYVIREPVQEEYVPEQDYQWDNPIIIDDLEF